MLEPVSISPTGEYAEVVGLGAGLAITILGAVWSLAIWISREFSKVRNLVYDKTDQIMKMFMDKLDYHEIHDDQRFAAITNDLWSIRVRNAAREGLDLDTHYDTKEKRIIRGKITEEAISGI